MFLKGRTVKTNPYPIHPAHTTPEQIRDAFLHVREELKGYSAEKLAGILDITVSTFHRYGHKLDSRAYQQIPSIQLDKLRQEAAVYVASDSDFRHLPFEDKRDAWTVGTLNTKSRMRAIYRHALSGEEIVAAPHNRTSNELTPAEDLVVRWFQAARHASHEQLMEASGLNEYDVGRVGYKMPWGIAPRQECIEALEASIRATMKTNENDTTTTRKENPMSNPHDYIKSVATDVNTGASIVLLNALGQAEFGIDCYAVQRAGDYEFLTEAIWMKDGEEHSLPFSDTGFLLTKPEVVLYDIGNYHQRGDHLDLPH